VHGGCAYSCKPTLSGTRLRTVMEQQLRANSRRSDRVGEDVLVMAITVLTISLRCSAFWREK
jgi:hypothetical protein